jgi:hypothetical protein
MSNRLHVTLEPRNAGLGANVLVEVPSAYLAMAEWACSHYTALGHTMLAHFIARYDLDPDLADQTDVVVVGRDRRSGGQTECLHHVMGVHWHAVFPQPLALQAALGGVNIDLISGVGAHDGTILHGVVGIGVLGLLHDLTASEGTKLGRPLAIEVAAEQGPIGVVTIAGHYHIPELEKKKRGANWHPSRG